MLGLDWSGMGRVCGVRVDDLYVGCKVETQHRLGMLGLDLVSVCNLGPVR